MKKTYNWEDIRNQIRKISGQKNIMDTDICKKCIWANTESHKILCSRYKCVKGIKKDE